MARASLIVGTPCGAAYSRSGIASDLTVNQPQLSSRVSRARGSMIKIVGGDKYPTPWGQRLTVRLTAGVILVLLVIGVPFLFAFHRLLREQQYQTLEQTTSSVGSLVVNGLRAAMTAGQPHLLDETILRLADQPEVERVILLNHNGRVSVSSDPAFRGRILDRGSEGTCIVCHRDGAIPPSSRMTVTAADGRRVFRTVTIIRNDEACHKCHDPALATNGLLLMDLTQQSFDRRFLTGIGSTVALGGVMVVLTVIVLVWLLRRMVLGPLEEIVASSQRIVEGHLESRASVSSTGEFARLAGQVNRMTDHLAASLQAVELQRTALQTILDAIDDEVVVLDRSRRVVTANEAYRRRQSDPLAEPAGRPCGEHESTHWPCGIDQPTGCPVQKVFESARLEMGIVSFVDSDGQDRVVEIHASPLVTEDGVVRQVVEVRRDISGRRQMEAILAHSEHLASLGLLASGLSHEINNPLGAIATSVEGLRRRLPDDEDVGSQARRRLDETLSRIAGEVGRCQTITHRLLRIARPSQRVRNLVDLNHVIEDVVAVLSYDIRQAGIRTELALGRELPLFRGDETQIVQVIMNVALNAIQAMTAGGDLRVKTFAERETLRIRIEDSGSGIPANVQKRIFEPFFTTKPSGKGTGLGLFITNQIVAGLGGTIEIQSEADIGTTVSILLPSNHGARE